MTLPTVERETEIPAEAFDAAEPRRVTRSEVPADVADFGAVFAEAGIELPLHGYGIDKVAEMLESKRLATLGREVKATAVMAALEAAGVPLRDVIQDAVKRDKALDAFEAAKGREIQELHARTETRIEEIKTEIDAFLKERNAELEQLKAAEEAANRSFLELQTRKRREEDRLATLVGHFLEGGPEPHLHRVGGVRGGRLIRGRGGLAVVIPVFVVRERRRGVFRAEQAGPGLVRPRGPQEVQ